MAKKSGTTRRTPAKSKPKRRSTKKRNSEESLSWGVIAIITLLLVALIGIFILRPKVKENLQGSKKSTKSEQYSSYKYDYNSWLMPEECFDREENLINHSAYHISYNKEYKNANWVAYKLVGNKLRGAQHKREDKFTPDPKLKHKHTTSSDFTRSGYDRGHLAPAADMAWSKSTMNESFYMTNISPQDPNFNRGVWKRLEEQTRKWAKTDSLLLIMTGPVLTPGLPLMGKSDIVIPEYFYKVVVDPVPPIQKAIAFVIPNKASKSSLRKYAVTIDSVEKLTGINFMESMPDGLEDRLEGSFNLKDWNWSTN
ncbi:MAG: DNA/RNA non-specific endonuclease [Bacteroidales bacterium]